MIDEGCGKPDFRLASKQWNSTAEKKIPAFTALVNVAFWIEGGCEEVRVWRNLLMALLLASVQKAAPFKRRPDVNYG